LAANKRQLGTNCLTLLATKSGVRRERPHRIHDLVFRYRLSALANRIFPETTQYAAPLSCFVSNGIMPICGVHAPEDIELLPDERHLLISEFPADFSRVTGDGLLIVDLATHRVQPLMVGTHPEAGWVREAATRRPRILVHMESISQRGTMVGRNCSWLTMVNANQSKS
jgi:hypothetical protein